MSFFLRNNAAQQVSLRAMSVFVFLLLNLSNLLAGEITNKPTNDDLVYRRIFVPADNPESWPIGSARYLPIRADEFARRREQAVASKWLPPSAHLRLQKILLRAHLGNPRQDDHWQIAGTAEMEIDAHGKPSGILSLEPLNMAITSAHWDGEDASPAHLGVWGLNHGETISTKGGGLGVLVERSGRLNFDWQAAGWGTDGQNVEFVIQTPASLRKHLEFVLPDGVHLEVTPGIVIQNDLHRFDQRMWQVELGSSTRHILRVYPRTELEASSGRESLPNQAVSGRAVKIRDPRKRIISPNRQPDQKPRVQVATDYHIAPDGLDMETTIRLADHVPDAMNLQPQLDGPIQIVSVKVDDAEVDWHVLETEESRFLQVPLNMGARGIKIHALAPLVLNQPWQMPKIRPQMLLWTEGSSHLKVDRRLQLQSLTPVGCTLQPTGGDNHPFVPGMEYSLLESSKQASLQLEVGQRPHRLHIRTATIASRRDNSVIGHAVALVRSDGDSQFFVEAEIHPGWDIVSAKTEPANELKEWHVYSNGHRQTVRVQLTRALQSEVPVRIELDGRATTDRRARSARTESLRMLHFRNVTLERELLLIESRESRQLVLGKGMQKGVVDADSVSAEDAKLLPEDWQGVLLDLAQLPAQSTLELNPRRATYACDARVELCVLPEVNEHRFGLFCTPTSGVVSEVLVHFSRPVLHALTWSIKGEDGSAPTLPDIGQVISTVDKSGTNHRLMLPLAMDKPFRLEAQYKVSRNEQKPNHPITPLVVRLPEASTTQAWVLLRSSEENLTVDRRGCTAVAYPAVDNESAIPILGCYRLDSANPTSPDNIPVLIPNEASTGNPSGEKLGQLFARHADFSTLLSARGTAMNVVVYHLENHGAKRAEVELPPHAVLQSAWVGTQPSTPTLSAGEDGAITFSLDSQDVGSSLTLRYVSEQQPLGSTALVRPAYPKTSFPVMQGRWTLWNSQQYAVAGAPNRSAGSQQSWRQRLFGPLARPGSISMFNPFHGPNWRHLGAELTGESSLPNRAKPWADEMGEDNSDEFSMPGWHAHSARFVDHPVPVELIRVDTARAHPLALWFLTTVVGTCLLPKGLLPKWLLTKGPRLFVVALIAAAATCFILEPTSLAIPQAIVLGLLSAVVVRSVWGGSGRWSLSRVTAPVTSTIALFLFASFFISRCDASPAGAKTDFNDNKPELLSVASNHTARILIPVDKQGQPVGEEIYIPESLYGKLLALTQEEQTVAPWVITAVHYRGSLSRGFSEQDARTRRFVCGDWTLSIDVTSLRPNCKLKLPLDHDQADWLEGRHLLDGSSVHLDWLPENKGCQVTLGQMGTHRLEIAMRPHVLRQPQSESLCLSSLAVADTTLELQVPEEMPDLEVVGATLFRRGAKGDRFFAVLPPKDRLEVRWTPAHRTVDRGADWIAELASWLHVEPSQAEVDVRLRITSGTGPLPLLQLETDPHLELLPFDSDSLIEDLETFPGNPRIIQLKLRPEIRTPVEIPIRFRLDRSTSIGRTAFPQVRLANVATVRRSMAVSVAAGLSYQEQRGEGTEVMSPTEFASAWGHPDLEATVEPLFAYTLTNHRPDWAIHVRPDPQSFTAKQLLQLRCGLEQTAVKYHAQIDDVAGKFFTHRLDVPADLRIESVTVQDQAEGEATAVRWARSADHQLTLFLTKPIRGPHALTLEGSLVHSPGRLHSLSQTLSIPRIVLQRTDASPTQLEITRNPEVLVHWDWPEIQREPIDKQLLLPAVNQEVPVGSFTLFQRSRKPLELKISRNDSRFSVDCLSTLAELNDGWSVTFWIHVRAQQGIVSRLHIEAPESWMEPSLVGLSGQVRQLKQASTQGRNAYEISLPHPLRAGEDSILQITGPLELDSDLRMRVPDIRVVDAINTTQYVALPRIAKDQPIEWIRRGLQRGPLPKRLEQAAQLDAAVPTYLAVQDRYRAHERVFSSSIRSSALRYAEMRGVVDRMGNWSGTAEIILQPGRASECQLKLPPQSHMLHLSVGSQAVPLQPTNDNRWKLSLGPPFMPRLITVHYTTKVDLQNRTATLLAPTIIVGERTLTAFATQWQIQTTDDVSLSVATVGQQISEYLFVRSAFEERLEVLSEASPLAFQLPRWEAEQWFLPWHRRLLQTKANWKNVESMLFGSSSAGEEAPPADNLSQDANAPTGGALAWQALTGTLNPQIKPVEDHTDATAQASQCYVGGKNGILQIDLVTAHHGFWKRFLSIGAILMIAAGAIYGTLRYPDWYQLLRRRPHGIALVAGFLWWLWLAPSVFGLVVVIVALGSLARCGLFATGQSTAILNIEEQSNQHAIG